MRIALAAFLTIVSLTTRNSPPCLRVGMLELNHYRTCQTDDYRDQVILWRWCGQYRRHNAIAWMFVNDHRCSIVQLRNGDYELTHGFDVRYKVRSRIFRETTTEFDPEMDNRKLFPVECRPKMPWN